jgi:hypothetical protein
MNTTTADGHRRVEPQDLQTSMPKIELKSHTTVAGPLFMPRSIADPTAASGFAGDTTYAPGLLGPQVRSISFEMHTRPAAILALQGTDRVRALNGGRQHSRRHA